jgi:hypothetical protein
MEGPSFHGEITKTTPHQRQTLSIDILQRRFGDVLVPFLCLSVWNGDDYDPRSEFALTSAGSRILADHLRAAADVMDGGPKDKAGPSDDELDDDACKGKLASDELRMLPLLRSLSNGIVGNCMKDINRNAA